VPAIRSFMMLRRLVHMTFGANVYSSKRAVSTDTHFQGTFCGSMVAFAADASGGGHAAIPEGCTDPAAPDPVSCERARMRARLPLICLR
jgi:hypothetical protein